MGVLPTSCVMSLATPESPAAGDTGVAAGACTEAARRGRNRAAPLLCLAAGCCLVCACGYTAHGLSV